jgi:hypothetical protein
MGLEYYTARFLLQARAGGAALGRVLTIGRQNLFVTAPQLQTLSSEFSVDLPPFLATQPQSDLAFVEPFFKKFLGAADVESLDFSAYEGATHVHDMNTPLPEHLKGRYDTIFEAGSLEHIFNFPTAIRNLMEALCPGGHLFIQTPANNYFGHGFYQFSPELFYRVLSEENGFAVRRMEVFEHFFPCHFFATQTYRVADPATVKKRVQLVNDRPTLMLIQATRTTVKPLFQRTPQQSDYVPLWQNQQQPATLPSPPLPTCLSANWKQKLYRLPLRLVSFLRLQYLANRSNKPALMNPEFFQRTP